VAGGIGLDPGAVQADRAQLQQFHFPRHLQYLHEQPGQFIEKASPEARQRVMVRVRASGNEAKRDRVVARPLDLAAGEHAIGVAIDQQSQKHRGVIRRAAPPGVGFLQCAQVQPVNHLDNEPCQVAFRKPVID
jgi:hypothetical protein